MALFDKDRILNSFFWGGGLLALLVWSYRGVEGGFSRLFTGEALLEVESFVSGLFPPDLSLPLLQEAFWGAGETFALSFMGTLLAIGLAFPLAFFASSTLTYRGILFALGGSWPPARVVGIGLYGVSRMVLNLLRTVPELLWALIFVFLTGLGPFPGVLALGFHTGGVLGKLFAETLENLDPAPLEALQSTGASRIRVFFYAVLPQAFPQLLSYTLYRWEVNIRAAAILGFVGAGGLGQKIHVALSLFWHHQLLTYLLTLYFLVLAVDTLSAYLRQKLL